MITALLFLSCDRSRSAGERSLSSYVSARFVYGLTYKGWCSVETAILLCLNLALDLSG